jgi:hypothetical protein
VSWDQECFYTIEKLTPQWSQGIGSTKSQAPSSKQISKLQFPKHERAIFELWALEFPWDLEFGIWDLSTLHAEVAELTFCHAGKSFNGVRLQDRGQRHLYPA